MMEEHPISSEMDLKKASRKPKREGSPCSLLVSGQCPLNGDGSRRVNVGKRHKCNVCFVAFSKPAHLQQHMVVHTGQRRFTCTHEGCTCSFKRQDHLSRHMLTHTGQVLRCPIDGCPVTCTLADNLRAHLKRHETVRFKCPEQECLFETAFKRQLWEHTRTMHKARHMCRERDCGKIFKFKSLLTAHSASVHGFKAETLVDLERNSSALEDASSTEHMGGQPLCDGATSCGPASDPSADAPLTAAAGPWACIAPGCAARFPLRRALKQHLTLAHLKERRYICSAPRCSSSFFSEADRARHIATSHHHSGASVLSESRAAHAELDFCKQEERARSIFDQPVFPESP